MGSVGLYSYGEVKRESVFGIEYTLLRVEAENGFIIAARGEGDFYCGTIFGGEDEALPLFEEIAQSGTPPYAIFDVIGDARKKIYFTNR